MWNDIHCGLKWNITAAVINQMFLFYSVCGVALNGHQFFIVKLEEAWLQCQWFPTAGGDTEQQGGITWDVDCHQKKRRKWVSDYLHQ